MVERFGAGLAHDLLQRCEDRPDAEFHDARAAHGRRPQRRRRGARLGLQPPRAELLVAIAGERFEIALARCAAAPLADLTAAFQELIARALWLAELILHLRAMERAEEEVRGFPLTGRHSLTDVFDQITTPGDPMLPALTKLAVAYFAKEPL